MFSPMKLVTALAGLLALSSTLVQAAAPLQPRTSQSACSYTDCADRSKRIAFVEPNYLVEGHVVFNVLTCTYTNGVCLYDTRNGNLLAGSLWAICNNAGQNCNRKRRELSDDEETIQSRQAKIVRDDDGSRSVEARASSDFY